MIREFHYRLPWRARGHLPGYHPGTQPGSGFEFRGHSPLLASPDPRRLDVRASLSDPFGQWLVRVFNQRASVPVHLVADLTASMGFVGHHRKFDVLADLAASLGYSAWRTGDPFGFVGFEREVRRDLYLPLTRLRGAGPDLGQRLQDLGPTGTAADGLLEVHRYLGRNRSLVFLASDFHFPLSLTERALTSLASHDVVPVVLWDPAEYRHLPRFGLVRLRDPETGREQTLLLRARLRQRIADSFAERREKLVALFTRAGRPPLFLEHGFDPDRLTSYFFRGWTLEAGSHAA